MVAQTHRFRLGDLECLAVNDGDHVYTAARYFPTAPAETIERELRRFGARPDEIVSPYPCLAVNVGSEWVLIDAGAGDMSPSTGHLLEGLGAEGIDPAAIREGVITHAHPDHIGGLLDSESRPVYPNARWSILREEWEFWASAEAIEGYRPFVEVVDKKLVPLRDRLVLVDREAEVAPGIRLEPALGHTPGHSVVVVESRGQRLYYVSDTVLHPIHLEHPEWQPVYDMDQGQAAASTRSIFDRAADERALVLAFHFPFPSVGHVASQGKGWKWVPIV